MRPLAIAAIGALLALTACGTEGGGEVDNAAGDGECVRSTEKVIYFDYPLTQLATYGNLQKFAEAVADERGYEIRYTADDHDVQKQHTNVQALVTQKVPAITSYPLEATAMENLAKEARDNCTVFVSYGVPLENQDASILFGNVESGKELGRVASEWAAELGEPVKALLIEDRSVGPGIDRSNGLQEALEGDPNIEIVATQSAGDRTGGENVTRDTLQAHPDLNMVLAYNDDSGMGARQAFLNAGKAADDPGIFVGGQDGTEEALEAVREGGIYRVTVAVRLKDIGEAVAYVPIDILEGKETEGVNVEPVGITHGHPQLEEYLSDY